MTFNELCTNTTKFGALSMPTGRVEIAWTIDEEKQRLRLSWTERGGPAVAPPSRRSFGTRMMELLGQQLSGQVRLAYDSHGLCLFAGCATRLDHRGGLTAQPCRAWREIIVPPHRSRSRTRRSGDLVGPDLEADQRVGAEGLGDRHIRGIAALGDQDAADPRRCCCAHRKCTSGRRDRPRTSRRNPGAQGRGMPMSPR